MQPWLSDVAHLKLLQCQSSCCNHYYVCLYGTLLLSVLPFQMFVVIIIVVVAVVFASRHELNFLLRHVSDEKFCMQLPSLQHSLKHTHLHTYTHTTICTCNACLHVCVGLLYASQQTKLQLFPASMRIYFYWHSALHMQLQLARCWH